MTELTPGAIARRDHLCAEPYGFHPLSGFPVQVRCIILKNGRRGKDEKTRLALTFLHITASVAGRYVPPDKIVEWWLYPQIEMAIRNCIFARPFNFEKFEVRHLDGFGNPA